MRYLLNKASTTTTTTSSTTPSNEMTTNKKINPCWTHLTEGLIHNSIQKCVVYLATHASKHPYTWILAIANLSIFLVAIGFNTNFRMELDQMVFLTPQGGYVDQHSEWIHSDESGFEKLRVLWLALHNHGDNVVHPQAMKQAILLMNTIQEMDMYQTVCSQSQYLDMSSNQPTCRVFSVSHFWKDDLTLLEQELSEDALADEEYIQMVLSSNRYPDGTPVFHEAILGNYQNTTSDETSWKITSAQSLILKIDIPDLGSPTDELETQLLDTLADLKATWLKQPEYAELEYFTFKAYEAEFQRAVDQDMPLVLLLIVVMISFTCLVFSKRRQPVQSRAMLGGWAFLTIACSLLTGYGIMFCAGVPLTNIGIMIPFVVVGVALDDTFIITSAFFRWKRDQPDDTPVPILIEKTMEEVAVSISMTTITTLICFFTGVASSIPAVQWLCLYAATTVGVDYLYQITFFVALLTLDENRVRANRRDICFWIIVKDDDESEESEEEDESGGVPSQIEHDGEGMEVELSKLELKSTESDLSLGTPSSNGPTPTSNIPQEVQAVDTSLITISNDDKESISTVPEPQQEGTFMERLMGRYADFILKPWVKLVVILCFGAYFGGCVYSTTLLYQEFNAGDYVPSDSFLTSFMTVFDSYTTINRYIGVYFRDVDQSDPNIQLHMQKYVQDLADLPQIAEPPAFFWVRDFPQLASSEQAKELGLDANALEGLSFNEQIEFALDIPQVRQIYGTDIVRDPISGNITASRTYLNLRHIDMYEVTNQVDMLMDQRRMTQAQKINSPKLMAENHGEFAFFTFDDLYYFWELYAVVVDELIFTTVSCVAVVSLVALVMIPHWSAICFVTPLIIILYFCLLGTMQYCGIKINSVTYFIIVMAIGLLVDFLMHMLLRYYESKKRTRHDRVKETLETMGASILLGGFTTWLGVIPLAFSTTKIFKTVFISFLAMVTLGCAVGLMLLPVLLSLWGPQGPEQLEQTESVVELESADEKFEKRRSSTITGLVVPKAPSSGGSKDSKRSAKYEVVDLHWGEDKNEGSEGSFMRGWIARDGSIDVEDQEQGGGAADQEESLTVGENSSSQKSHPSTIRKPTYQKEQRKTAAGWRSLIEEYGPDLGGVLK